MTHTRNECRPKEFLLSSWTAFEYRYNWLELVTKTWSLGFCSNKGPEINCGSFTTAFWQKIISQYICFWAHKNSNWSLFRNGFFRWPESTVYRSESKKTSWFSSSVQDRGVKFGWQNQRFKQLSRNVSLQFQTENHGFSLI